MHIYMHIYIYCTVLYRCCSNLTEFTYLLFGFDIYIKMLVNGGSIIPGFAPTVVTKDKGFLISMAKA